MYLSYFHINDKEVSFLHTVWACLPHSSPVIMTSLSVPLSFYYVWNQSKERQEILSYADHHMQESQVIILKPF